MNEPIAAKPPSPPPLPPSDISVVTIFDTAIMISNLGKNREFRDIAKDLKISVGQNVVTMIKKFIEDNKLHDIDPVTSRMVSSRQFAAHLLRTDPSGCNANTDPGADLHSRE